jgi:type I restriction enzyme S subunit
MATQITTKTKDLHNEKLHEKWGVLALGDFLSLEYGKPLKEEDRVGGDVPVYGSNGIVGFHDKKLVDGPGIIVGRKGSAGEVIYSNTDFYPIDTTYFIKTDLDKKFIYYLLKNFDLKRLVGSSAVPGLNRNDVYSQNVNIPTQEKEQKAIAEILSSLDEKIELNRKINSNLEKIASLLFKQWFVDFEFPNENGKPFKSSGGRMIDSELGEIPKGWSIGFLGDNKLTQLVKPGIDEFKGEKIYLPTANVNESSIVDLNYKITYYNRPSRANMQPFPNSIWFAKMKNSKKVQLFLEREKWKLKNVILSTGFTGIRPLSNSTFYIWTIINSDFFEREKSNLAIGTTMQAINNENIRRIRYIIPQKNILDCFEKKVCMLYEAISINKEQIKSFSKIRDSLLPRLMSGKIRVKI